MAQTNNSIKIDELRSIAAKLDGYAAEYQTTYTALISAAEDLESSCKGDIITVYINQVKDLDDDFKKMQKAMSEYADALRTAAAQYETVDTQSQQQIRSLETNLGMKG